jgi:FixJ family two-component response regulator
MKKSDNSEKSGNIEDTVTNREKQVLMLLVNGMGDKEIAKELYISCYVKETYRKHF